MYSLAGNTCLRKWVTARPCVRKTDAWQVIALHNLAVAIETTSTTDHFTKKTEKYYVL
jgi:hypothetical protein